MLLLSIAVFASSLAGSPIWEDRRLIAGPERTIADCFRMPFLGTYFRPLVSVSFLIDRGLAGGVPFQFHQTNVLLHAVAAALVMAVVGASFRSRLAGLAAGFVFALQPVQTSTVAWIGGRTDALCIAFALLHALGLFKARDCAGPARLVWLTVASIGFLAAALAKEQALALLPLAPLAMACDPSPRFPDRARRAVHATLATAVAALVFLILWRNFGGKAMVLVDHGWAYRLRLSGQSLLHYALLLIVPNPISMHAVTTTPLQSVSPWGTALAGYAVLSGLVAGGILLVRARVVAAYWLAWALLAIVPVANLVPVSSLIVAPYRAALSGVGVAALCGLWVSRMPRHGKVARCAAALAFAGAAALTAWGSTLWVDEATILRTMRRCDPGSLWVREGEAGVALATRHPEAAEASLSRWLDWAFGGRGWDDPQSIGGRFRRGPFVLERILAGNGDKRAPATAVADVLTLLAYARIDLDALEGAVRALAAAAVLDPSNPSVALARGRLWMRRERWADAVAEFDRSIAGNPRVPTAHILRGLCLRSLARWRDAESAFQAASRLEPWVGRTWIMLSEMRDRQGDAPGARRALEAGRANARTDVGEIESLLGRTRSPSGDSGQSSGHSH